MNHIDGDKENNKLENLQWATYEEQQRSVWENKVYEIIETLDGEEWKNCKINENLAVSNLGRIKNILRFHYNHYVFKQTLFFQL